MGRSGKKTKKKTNHATQEESISSLDIAPKDTSGSPIHQNQSLGGDGWIELLVEQTEKKYTPETTIAHDKHSIFMHHSDAEFMKLSTGDKVLVLSLALSSRNVQTCDDNLENISIPYAAICTVETIYSALNKTTKKKINIRKGSARISPGCLEERLTQTSHKQAIKSTDKSSGENRYRETPSPSNSKFSFSNYFGDDDKAVSPIAKRLYSPKNSDVTGKDKVNATSIIVFPYDKNGTFALANKIWNCLVSHDTSSLTLELVEKDFDSQRDILTENLSLNGNKIILEKLAIAALHGAYLQKGDFVYIPFRGIKRKFTVLDTGDKSTMKQIENDLIQVQRSFSAISLQRGEKCAENDQKHSDELQNELYKEIFDISSSRVSKFIQQMLQSLRTTKFNPILYAITKDTKIMFASSSSNGSNPTQPVSSDHLEVGGLSQILQTLKIALETPLFQPELFQRNSTLRVPRGVLLFGQCGVGKTALTHQLSRELSGLGSSSQLKVNIRYVQCQSLISSSIVGENERLLSSLFSPSDKSVNTSTLLILDDIHLICPRRVQQGNRSSNQIASTLLSLLDGIDTLRWNLVILGITRSPSDLDPALRRPGRLDLEVEIPIPDDIARADIFKVQVCRFTPILQRQLNDESYLSLAKKAKGFTGADTLLAIKEAIRMSILSGKRDRMDSEITLEQLNSAIQSVTPSTLRTSPQALVEIPTVQWSDIGGMENPKRLLREAISLPLTHAVMFDRLGISPPKGVLLYGPPGCSKTLLARALATEGQMNFMAVKGPELLSKWLGESERALAGLFRRARQASPCVIFFDEVDAIAGKRGSGDGGGGGERILSQLLTELDGVGSNEKNIHRVVVVGATNRPDLLDEALMRPGRIDRKIFVGVPDEQSRQSILNIGLSNGKRCDSDVDIKQLAGDNYTAGFSGAEIVAICREAALYAIEEDEEFDNGGKPLICLRHMKKSIKGMKRQITPEMLEFYASFNKKTS